MVYRIIKAWPVAGDLLWKYVIKYKPGGLSETTVEIPKSLTPNLETAESLQKLIGERARVPPVILLFRIR
jgi:hypothetical protein